MTVAITNLRRRLVTLLIPQGGATTAVRIASMQTAAGLPDVVLDLPTVQQGIRSGDLEVRREAVLPALPTRAEATRARKVKSDG